MRKLFLALFVTGSALSPALATAPDDAFKEKIGRALPNATVHAVRPASIPGFYEVEVENQLVYVSTDGKYMLLGDMIDLGTRTNMTETWREKTAARLLDEVGEKQMIVMGPAKPKRTITVFTDVDCPYCVKLHREVPELTKNGVKVRYLLFPRGGAGSDTYRRSVAVWCASDRVKAVGIAKERGNLEMKTCANPVDEHYKLGERLGVGGTPTIYLDDGKKLGGYVPAGQLLAILGINNTPAVSHAR